MTVPDEKAAPPTDANAAKDAAPDAAGDAKPAKPASGKPKPEPEEEELSEEDLKLKEELEMLVERLAEPDASLYAPALHSLTTLIRTSTSSMTAVPKPLKFLKPHIPKLDEIWQSWPPGPPKSQLAGILSVLGMTQGSALHYRLLVDSESSDESELEAWGHEYLRHLALEIGDEFHKRVDEDEQAATGDLLDLALRIVPFFLKHNAETDAVDLILEVEAVERLVDPGFVDAETYQRVCQYLTACVSYLDTDTADACLHTAFTLYKQNNELPQALLLAIRLDDEELVRSVFADTNDSALRKQLAFIVARQRRFYDLTDLSTDELPEDIAPVLQNSKLSEYFHYLAKELNLEKLKSPHEVFRTSGDLSSTKVYGERTKMNLAMLFTRAFVNAGYSNYSEGFPEIAGSAARTKANSAAAYTSLGLGYLWDYDTALQELQQYIGSEQDTPAENVQAGALLGIGVATTGVHDESEGAKALLSDYATAEDNNSVKTSAILGLGFAYAGTAREDMAELLEPLVVDASLPIEVSAIAALALGIIFVGSANGNLTTSIMEAFIEREHTDLTHSWSVFMGLGLALLYVGKADKIEAAVETIKAIDHPVSQTLEVLLVICAYAGTGNVLQIQRLLREAATRHYEDEDEDEDDGGDDAVSLATALAKAAGGAAAAEQANGSSPSHEPHVSSSGGPSQDVDMSDAPLEGGDSSDHAARTNEGRSGSHTAGGESGAADSSDAADTSANGAAAAPEDEDPATRHESAKVKGLCTLGIAVIAMGENIGEEMVQRHFEHLMHYGDSYIRQAVPLAMGLISASNPEMKVYETLSRYTHEPDFGVALNAIFAMGLVGAGTLNARVAQLLRQLDEYYARQSDLLFMVRIALGLVNLGKGTLTLSPFNAEKELMSPVSLAGLLVVSLALLTPPSKLFLLSEHPGLLYALTLAIQPRMLMTVDEDLKPLKVTVRVGQAVDTVGQAGKPKTITGWVTQDTPVLLSTGERAELEDDDYVPLSSALEGVVILRKREEDE